MIAKNLARMMEALAAPGAVRALCAWPKFSISSYQLVHRLVAQGVKANTVLDVGANVGQFAVAAANLFPGSRVHSFEPQPECLAALQKISRKMPQIAIHPIALGESAGVISMRLNAHNHSSSLLPISTRHIEAFPDARETGTLQVRVSTLDEVVQGFALTSPILLKLDVQGFEDRVLAGARTVLRKIDHVVLETSFAPLYEGERTFLEMLNIMSEYGFAFLRPVGFLPHPETGELLQCDALFKNLEISA